MNKREAEFTTKLERWMEHNLSGAYAWEIKAIDVSVAKNESDMTVYFNTKSFKKEIENLDIFKRFGTIYKFPDLTGFGTPYDGITIKNVPRDAYVFVQFWKPRQKEFYMIDIDVILWMRDKGHKGISEKILESIKSLGGIYKFKLGTLQPR